MKSFTLIEADRYIAVDGKGVWFKEEDWPFPDIEHLWAIQWRDDGTPDGRGHIEYDSADRQNDPATRKNIERYIDAWQAEVDKREAERIALEEQEKKNAYSWSEAMRELEEQMEAMELRHAKALNETQTKDKIAYDRLQEQLREQEDRHASSLLEMMRDHDTQMETVHKEIERQHEELFYGQDLVEDQETSFESTNGLDNITMFDGNVDSSLFDEVISEDYFSDNVDDEDTVVQSTFEEKEPEKSEFSDVDLSILDSEFNLELLFDEDPEEQVVAEIENLIAEDESEVAQEEVKEE